jgi:hypothetical protein
MVQTRRGLVLAVAPGAALTGLVFGPAAASADHDLILADSGLTFTTGNAEVG